MHDKHPESAKGDEKYGPLPRLGLPVQVQCEGFKCMAYRDKNGKWIDFFTHESLSRVLGVVRV
jgi:hypothetical protein